MLFNYRPTHIGPTCREGVRVVPCACTVRTHTRTHNTHTHTQRFGERTMSTVKYITYIFVWYPNRA